MGILIVLVFIRLIVTSTFNNTDLNTNEYIFQHPSSNIKIPYKFQSKNFSDAFKVAIIALRLYSIINRGFPVCIIGTDWYITFLYFKRYSLFTNLIHFVRYGGCLDNWGTKKEPNWRVDIFRFGRHCFTILRFRNIRKGNSISDIIKRGSSGLIVVYIMRIAVREKGIYTFELAVLLSLRVISRNKSYEHYECTYINTLNEINSIKFKVIDGHYVHSFVFILNPWYYIA